MLHFYLVETAGAGTPTITYNAVSLKKMTGTLWELIAPASGSNTLSITYGANSSTHAAFVWAVDGVNQDSPWLIGFPRATRGGVLVPTTTSPFVANSDQTVITLETAATSATVSASDGALTTTSIAFGTNTLYAGYKQGAGAVFDPRWSIDSTLTAAQYAIIYRPAAVALTAGAWYALTSNNTQEDGASTTNIGDQNIVPINSAVQFTKISSNNGVMAAAFDASGNGYTWGSDNGVGMLCDGSTHSFNVSDRATPTLVSGISGVVDVCVGNLATYWVKSDGTVFYWGQDFTSTTNHTTATQVTGLSGIVRVAAADACILALDNTGKLWFVGDNTEGQAGNGAHTGVVSTPFNMLSGVADFAMSEFHATACTTGGTAYCWGSNNSACTGQGTSTGFTTTPTTVSGPSNVIQVAALDEPCTLALTSSNQVWHWGGGSSGEGGDGAFSFSYTPHQITMPGGQTYTTLTTNFRGFECYVLTASKTVFGWGLNPFGGLGRNGFASVGVPQQLFASLLINIKLLTQVGDDGWFALIAPTTRGRSYAMIIGY